MAVGCEFIAAELLPFTRRSFNSSICRERFDSAAVTCAKHLADPLSFSSSLFSFASSIEHWFFADGIWFIATICGFQLLWIDFGFLHRSLNSLSYICFVFFLSLSLSRRCKAMKELEMQCFEGILRSLTLTSPTTNGLYNNVIHQNYSSFCRDWIVHVF